MVINMAKVKKYGGNINNIDLPKACKGCRGPCYYDGGYCPDLPERKALILKLEEKEWNEKYCIC